MTRPSDLSSVAAEYLDSMQSRGLAKGTLRIRRLVLSNLVTHVGNIQIKNITPRHVDSYFTWRQTKKVQPSTLNLELNVVRHFFGWCGTRKYIGVLDSPVADRRAFKQPQKSRLRVPATDFGRLLDGCNEPRDRIVVALGLYLFLRQGEITTLKIKDLDLDGGLLAVYVHKTGQFDYMPICTELDVELRRWLDYYVDAEGALNESWFLTPAKQHAQRIGVGRRTFAPDPDRTPGLRPTRQMVAAQLCAHRALVAAGHPVRTEDDKPSQEGIHTLRRSGARALFDQLLEDGYDGALRTVQAMLHHASSKTTEIYLGLDLDRKRRDDLLRNRPMFPAVISTSQAAPMKLGVAG